MDEAFMKWSLMWDESLVFHVVASQSAVQVVVSGAAAKEIPPLHTEQCIMAGLSVELIASHAAIESIVAVTTVELVAAGVAIHHIVATRS